MATRRAPDRLRFLEFFDDQITFARDHVAAQPGDFDIYQTWPTNRKVSGINAVASMTSLILRWASQFASRMLCVRRPEADDVLAQRFVRQKEVDGPW